MGVLLLLLSLRAFGATLVGCDGELGREFSRAPDARGTVTSRFFVTPETLRAAYLNGLFPMGTRPDGRSFWKSPARRGVLFLDEVRVPRSDRKIMQRLLNRGDYVVETDRDLGEVIRRCRDQARGGAWITEDIVHAFEQAHAEGFAHCDVVYRDGRMVAGNYGLDLGGVYSGESMFHEESDAGKLALAHLIERLRADERRLLDVQQAAAPYRNERGIVPHQPISLPVRWGAREVSRAEYLRLLRTEQARYFF